MKTKNLFLISYFKLSKKRNGTLGTRINPVHKCCVILIHSFGILSYLTILKNGVREFLILILCSFVLQFFAHFENSIIQL